MQRDVKSERARPCEREGVCGHFVEHGLRLGAVVEQVGLRAVISRLDDGVAPGVDRHVVGRQKRRVDPIRMRLHLRPGQSPDRK